MTTSQVKTQVHELLQQMTLQEKICQLGGHWFYEFQTQGRLDTEKVRVKLKHGIGQITRIAGSGNLSPL